MLKRFCSLLFVMLFLTTLTACLDARTQGMTDEDFHRINFEAAVHIDDGLNGEQREILGREISAMDYVAAVTLVTPSEALANLANVMEVDIDFFWEALEGENPLRYTFLVNFENIPCTDLGAAVDALEDFYGAAFVNFNLFLACVYCFKEALDEMDAYELEILLQIMEGRWFYD